MRRALLLSLAVAAGLFAQNAPHLAYLYPAGGQRGTTFQVKAWGQFLAGVSGVYVSGGGLEAVAVDYARPMTPMQATELREKLQELQKQPADAQVQEQIADIRQKLATFRRNLNPALAETATLRVTLAPGARPGQRELRLATPQGLSNPVAFLVGDLPESGEEAASFTLPATLNGRIVPRAGPQYTFGGVDRYRFQALRGQRLAVAVSARELMPYLADTVPGWFQPAVALLDDQGKELAYADHDLFRPDPLLRCQIPADGEYRIEIRDVLYRGREDFVYRMTVTEDVVPKERSESRLRAIRPGQWDTYPIQGRAGKTIVAEVYARRFGSPLDSVLKLTDRTGRQLAFNDDHDDKGFGLLTHQADSLLTATLPADGTYYLHVGDAQGKGGPEYTYRVRIGPPQPDYELRVTPSSINAAPGTSVPITVYALRKDGFSGEIALSLKGAPRGLTLSGGRVPAGQDQIRLTLTAPAAALTEPLDLSLEGRATILGRQERRLAVPAEDMVQAFTYHHLAPAQELKLATARRAGFRTPPRPLGELPLRIAAGGTAQLGIELQMPPNAPLGQARFELSQPPEGIEMQVREGSPPVLRFDAAKAKPGLQGNLIVAIWAPRQPGGQRVGLGVLPAIPFEIVEH